MACTEQTAKQSDTGGKVPRQPIQARGIANVISSYITEMYMKTDKTVNMLETYHVNQKSILQYFNFHSSTMAGVTFSW